MELGPRLIFWEITQKCNLKCPYCRREGLEDKGLTLELAIRAIDSLAQGYRPLLIFTGGEPLVHPYFFQMASYARTKGLKIAMATNGTLIDQDLAIKISSIGFDRVAISLDSTGEEINDSLRQDGSYVKTIAGIQHLKFQGVNLQVNTTILKRNFRELHGIYKFCLGFGIKALHLFAFVPVGCGETVPENERLSQEEFEEFLNEVAGLSLESNLEIKVTCAPHYNRVLQEKMGSLESITTKGCLAGTGVCFISSKGDVYPCGYLPLGAGNIFESSFREIWEGSSLFQTLRSPDYLKGRCRICEYRGICGGCRARAWARTNDYLEEEPDCVYQPSSVIY